MTLGHLRGGRASSSTGRAYSVEPMIFLDERIVADHFDAVNTLALVAKIGVVRKIVSPTRYITVYAYPGAFTVTMRKVVSLTPSDFVRVVLLSDDPLMDKKDLPDDIHGLISWIERGEIEQTLADLGEWAASFYRDSAGSGD